MSKEINEILFLEAAITRTEDGMCRVHRMDVVRAMRQRDQEAVKLMRAQTYLTFLSEELLQTVCERFSDSARLKEEDTMWMAALQHAVNVVRGEANKTKLEGE